MEAPGVLSESAALFFEHSDLEEGRLCERKGMTVVRERHFESNKKKIADGPDRTEQELTREDRDTPSGIKVFRFDREDLQNAWLFDSSARRLFSSLRPTFSYCGASFRKHLGVHASCSVR